MSAWPRRFARTSLLAAFAAAAAGGCFLTLVVAQAGSITGIADAGWFIAVVNANVHALVIGWVGLFAVGCVHATVPERWHSSAPAPLIYVLLTLGVIAHVGGELASLRWPEGMRVALGGSIAEALATLIFAAQCIATWRQIGSPQRCMLMIGALFFLFAVLFDAWYAFQAAAVRDDFTGLVRVVSTWQQPLRNLQVHGMALFLLIPLARIVFPAEAPDSTRKQSWCIGLLLAAVIAEMTFFLAYRLGDNHVFAALLLGPWALLLAVTTLMTAPWRWWTRGDDDTESRGFLRAACFWLAISLVMHLCLRPYNVALGAKFSHAYFAAMGQATALGFVMQMLMALTTRLAEPARRRGLLVLINLGVAAQVGALIGTDWNRAWSIVLAGAGIVQAVALALWISRQWRELKRV